MHTLKMQILLTRAPGARVAGAPTVLFLAHLTWLNFPATPMGSVSSPTGAAAGLQMVVRLDKAVLLPRSGDITQTLSPPAYKNPSVLAR